MSLNRMTTASIRPRIVVWDPVVRLGHWVLVAAFAIAFVSAEEEQGGPDPWHVWAGYAIGVIVAIRLVWGFLGPRYARFSDFVWRPAPIMRYLGDLVLGRTRRYLGHSPAGGAMTLALLISLPATVGTGVVEYGDKGKGPLADDGMIVVTQAHAEGDEGESGTSTGQREGGNESILSELHSTLANVTLFLIVLHILGVGLASIVHRENLVAAMIDGKKRAD